MKTAEKVETEIADGYEAKLSLKDFVLPDLFDIKERVSHIKGGKRLGEIA